MFNSIVRAFSQRQMQFNPIQLPLAGLMLMVSVATGNASPIPTQSSVVATPSNQTQVAQTAPASRPIPDGVYLYGQSSQPEEIGKEYMVFEVRQNRVIGAVYMPNSEFNCFHGTVGSQKLDLMVANPMAETADSSPPEKRPTNEFAAVGDFPRINDGPDPISFPFSVSLQDYQRLARVSENDQRILGMCKANYQEQVWSR